MKSVFFTLSLSVFLVSCHSGSDSAPAAAQDTPAPPAYELEDIPGADASRAVLRDGEGQLLEEGTLRSGLKTGTWIAYHPGGEFPKTAVSYINGMYNGPYMEFNARGQLELRATYLNNKLHGPWVKYRFGRPEAEAGYKNGELHGTYLGYDTKTGKVQKEINYKNGVQHGAYRFYNEEGVVTLEYEYRDGERVGGGIKNTEAAQ